MRCVGISSSTTRSSVSRTLSEIERSTAVDKERSDVSYGDELLAVGTTLLTFGLRAPDFDMSFLADWITWRDQRNQG